VRDLLNLQFAGKTYDLHFLLGDVHVESSLLEDQAHVFGRADGLFAFFPLGNGLHRLVADNPPEQLRMEQRPKFTFFILPALMMLMACQAAGVLFRLKS
jgi:2-polyprenyl-6-methoxyphenol hydroxylase-like FAD-dependent oxidoreductase